MQVEEKYSSWEHLMNQIQEGNQTAKAKLYRYLKNNCFQSITKYLQKSGAQKEDAQDLFHEAFIILLKSIEASKFKLSTISVKSYSGQFCSFLMSTVKNLWFKEIRWRKRRDIPQESQEEFLIQEIPSLVVMEHFNHLGNDCRTLLSLYFNDMLSATVIGRQLGMSTPDAKAKIKVCIKKISHDLGHLLGGDKSEYLREMLYVSLESMGERCQSILAQFYFKKYSMTQIAQGLNFANAHVAANEKNKCLKTLNERILERILKTR